MLTMEELGMFVYLDEQEKKQQQVSQDDDVDESEKMRMYEVKAQCLSI